MQTNDVLIKQYQYNYWANERIFQKAALVSKENFNETSVVEGRSLQQILSHLVRVEKIWRLLACDGELDPAQLPADEQMATVGGMLAFARQEEKEMLNFLAGLSEEELAENLTVTRWDGVKVSMFRWQMLLHLANHSMQHRSEAAVLLTLFSHSPGDLDFLFFVL